MSLDFDFKNSLYIIRFTSTLSPAWIKTILPDSAKGDAKSGERWRAYTVDTTVDGGYVLAGRAWHTPIPGAFVMKLDSSGLETWRHFYGSLGFAEARAVKTLANGDYMVAGRTSGNDLCVYTIDDQGNVLDSATFGSSGSDMAYGADVTSDGDYVLAGYTTTSTQGQNIYVVKTPGYSCCTCPTRGNLDNSTDCLITMGDLTVLIDYLYESLTPLTCPVAGNLDLSPDGLVTAGDLTVLIDHLFISLAPLPECPQ